MAEERPERRFHTDRTNNKGYSTSRRSAPWTADRTCTRSATLRWRHYRLVSRCQPDCATGDLVGFIGGPGSSGTQGAIFHTYRGTRYTQSVDDSVVGAHGLTAIMDQVRSSNH